VKRSPVVPAKAGTPSAPAPPISLLLGDCLHILHDRTLGSFDLIYMDPPFNTGSKRSDRNGSFPDSWPGIDEYLAFIRPRLRAAMDALAPDGSILVHCDWRTCHHLRLLLDDLLGPRRFVNHLIWQYGLGGSSPRRFARKHDDILFYAKSDGYYFQPPRIPATSNRMKGRDKKATDILDIPSINNMSHERTGYPTQKPLALLTLLINACCPPRSSMDPSQPGRVLDPFCGSGTTLLAASALGRAAVGIDINPRAITVARRRLHG
jgi:site-specific DNA-methyltransferase (adenine-specific)